MYWVKPWKYIQGHLKQTGSIISTLHYNHHPNRVILVHNCLTYNCLT